MLNVCVDVRVDVHVDVCAEQVFGHGHFIKGASSSPFGMFQYSLDRRPASNEPNVNEHMSGTIIYDHPLNQHTSADVRD